MTPIISLLLPSRGRAKLVERLFDSIVLTTNHLENIEIILYLDEDDVASHYLDNSSLSIIKLIGKQKSMGFYNSECLANARGDIIVLINDDLVFRTKGWDDKLIAIDNKFADKIYLAYANDLFKKKWCSFPVLSRKTCEALINPYPVDYQGAFIDTHLYDVFKRLEREKIHRICYLEDVVFEHMHYRIGKAQLDDTYKKRGRFVDDASFVELAAQRQLGAEHLKNIINGNKSQFILQPILTQYSPQSIFDAFKRLTTTFLLSRKLPFRWRFFLWYWFIGRYLASRGFLWPIVKL